MLFRNPQSNQLVRLAPRRAQAGVARFIEGLADLDATQLWQLAGMAQQPEPGQSHGSWETGEHLDPRAVVRNAITQVRDPRTPRTVAVQQFGNLVYFAHYYNVNIPDIPTREVVSAMFIAAAVPQQREREMPQAA